MMSRLKQQAYLFLLKQAVNAMWLFSEAMMKATRAAIRYHSKLAVRAKADDPS